MISDIDLVGVVVEKICQGLGLFFGKVILKIFCMDSICVDVFVGDLLFVRIIMGLWFFQI